MVTRLKRFDETLYDPKKICKTQTELEGEDNTLYVPKKKINTKNPRYHVPRCPLRGRKKVMEHASNTLVEIVPRDSREKKGVCVVVRRTAGCRLAVKNLRVLRIIRSHQLITFGDMKYHRCRQLNIQQQKFLPSFCWRQIVPFFASLLSAYCGSALRLHIGCALRLHIY